MNYTNSTRHKQQAMKDRHNPRHTSYRPSTEKKAGAGTGSWGSVDDFAKSQEELFFEKESQLATSAVNENIEQNSSPHSITMDDFLPSI